MNCYECAIQGESVPAVATCTHCGVGMCIEHFRAEQDYWISCTTYGCRHDMGTRPKSSAAAQAKGHMPHRHRAAR